MIAQVLIVLMQMYFEANWLEILWLVFSVVLIGFCWLCSFSLSIPCHRKIALGQGTADVLERLVRTNWPRTVLWTGVFLLGFM